ncbi:hypothetical protein VHEMI08853 [[Torrubiella] hemipterigena]|uniref:Integrase catalytic domain-containing protein n=1 Tax=[Torrubiella] hemipterigena TaxID=1531966 RepID=A0A0A1TPA7_9HYPO|nr:hypothetical protein VHEMI08853 [[Torrubiella] hemipterigena]
MEEDYDSTIFNPLPNDVRKAFDEFIHGSEFNNRERIEYSKWVRLHVHLDKSNLVPEPGKDSRLRYRAYEDFEFISKRLYRQPDQRFPNPRYVVPESEVFDIIVKEHLRLLHTGQDKTWDAIKLRYYGIKREDVIFVVKRCKNCALNRPSAIKAPLVPIISERAWERIQADLIDMRHEPSGQFKWILHIKDHFTKYSQLYALTSKQAEPIAKAFLQFIGAFLPPKIVQVDNGREFQGAFLILLRKYGIQIINGSPRSPQTQGLVEQANRVVSSKITAWKADHQSTQWEESLTEIMLAMNTQIHSSIKHAPAELLFRDRSSYKDWLNNQMRRDP